jgi:phage-related protein
MQKLNEYLERENQNRKILIKNLNQNMQKIQKQLQNKQNYRRFYWTNDLNEYGFIQSKINARVKGEWDPIEKEED